MTWDDVRELALGLPEVEEGTAYRKPALRVGGKVFAAVSPHEDALAVRAGFVEREFLLQADPEAFYVTPHYEGHPWVLVRLDRVDPENLRDVLTESWLLRAPKRLAEEFAPPEE